MKFSRKDYNERIIDTANRIPVDEPCFLLRAQDKLAPKLLLEWATAVRLSGGDPAMAAEAEEHAQEMIRWQNTHKVKTPDMYRGSVEKSLILDELKKHLGDFKFHDIKKFVKLLGDYYDRDGLELIHILLPVDLKIPNTTPSTLDDFQLTPETKLRCSKCKVIIYSDPTRGSIILKNEVI